MNNTKARDKRKLRLTAPQVLGFAATFAFFTFVYIVGPGFILPSQTVDAQIVADMAVDVDDVSNGSGGYYYTALLLSYLPPGGEELLVIGVAILLITAAFAGVKSIPAAALVSFLCIAPILLFLFTYIKDTFTPILTILCLFALQSKRPLTVRAFTVAALYIIYGVFFRQYYLLILVVFIGFLTFRISNWYFRLSLALLAISAFILLPDAYFYELGNARDYVNRGRWVDASGNRTVFFNLVPATNAFNFIINYAYAIARLNFPFLFSFGAKELFLTINLWVYAFLLATGLSSFNERVKLPALLFASHIVVLQIFEPDLGSYLRHVSSVLLYLVPALTLWDQRLLGVRAAASGLRRAGPARATHGRRI